MIGVGFYIPALEPGADLGKKKVKIVLQHVSLRITMFVCSKGNEEEEKAPSGRNWLKNFRSD